MVAVVAPLVAAMVGQLVAVGADYHPPGDLADIELHTRDVGRPGVELGQYSRSDWSHPGPALFYALAVPYRLMGSASVGMNVGALLINATAVIGILIVLARRGRPALFWPGCVVMALVLRGFGPAFLIAPWNPSVPVLAFGLFTFLLWEAVVGSRWATVLAAVVGTFCVQTHVGYAPLVLPLAGSAVVLHAWARWRDRASAPATLRVGRDRRWWWLRTPTAATVAVLVVLWLPPIVEELRADHGNLSRIVEYFGEGEGEEQSRTLGDGITTVFHQLTLPPEWLTGDADLTPLSGEVDLELGTPWPLLLIPIGLATAWWWRRRDRSVLTLLALVGAGGVLSAVAVSRTLGPLYHYRLGWITVLAAIASLLVLSALWSAVTARWPERERRFLVPLSGLALAGLAVVGVPAFARAGPPLAEFSDGIGQLAPQVAAALPPGEGPVILRCDGDEGCGYLAGIVLWMERHGIHVQVDNAVGVVASGSPHRVYSGGPVRAVLHVRLDWQLYFRAREPDVEVLARIGEVPTESRAALARELAELREDHAQGRVSDATLYAQQNELAAQIGSGVGVLLEARTAPPTAPDV